MKHLRLLARILSGLKATGIPCTDITAGTKVIGLVLRIPGPAGLVRASRADFFTMVTGKAIAVALSIITNGTAIVNAIITGIASTTSITTTITTTITKHGTFASAISRYEATV